METHAKHTALDVAAWFLANPALIDGEKITHLKLQKLVYYAQGWSLALLGTPLFDEELEAWAHGPVARSLYRAFAPHGWDYLAPIPDRAIVEFGEQKVALLKEVAESYGSYSAKRLEHMSHQDEPWISARGNLPPEARSNAVIDKSSMAAYFTKLYAESNDAP